MALVEQVRHKVSRRPAAATLVGTLVGGLAAGLVLNRLGRTSAGYDVRGRTVLITGGSRGLGLVLAREFGRLGARVVLVARSELELRRAERMLREEGLDVAGVVGDVRETVQVARVVADVVAHTGGIDVLVNNAGIIQVAPLAHTQLEDYEDSLNTHFWGPVYLIQGMSAAHAPARGRTHPERVVDWRARGGAAPRALLGGQVRPRRPLGGTAPGADA
jgi:NAD(P)-dependent dehydrogenase (short-subunit alcohol dehydrogenase family)